MNIKQVDPKFTVYEHISPEGKRYIGITSRSVEDRWENGRGYIDNTHLWGAINKYGWNNFEHNILATNLSLIEASNLESELISTYDTMNPDKGYNHTTGGNWSRPDDITRQKLSEVISARCANPEYRKQMSERLIGHPVSNATRAKISRSKTGHKMSEDFCAKQRNRRHSPETLAKLRGHSSWCKGLTKDTDDRLKRISDKLKGRPMDQNQKDKLSAIHKARYASGFSLKWITNGLVELQIQSSEPIPEGFKYGRLSVLDTYIHKGSVSKKIAHSDVSKYVSDGWELGRPESISNSIRSSLQRMHWELDGKRFESANELATYLRSNGYPNIVGSTITNLWKKGFATSPSYSSLEGRIVRVDHED